MNERLDAGVMTQVSDPGAYFQQIENLFDAAVRARPDQLVEQDFMLADQRVRTRFVGTLLAEYLTQPFAHLLVESSDQPPALLWDSWDSEVTGILRPMPPPPEMVLTVSADAQTTHRILGHNQVTQTESAKTTRWINGPARHVINWYESARACTMAERTRPLMDVLPRWLPTTGAQMFHAGLVAAHGRGALLVGASGTGKTTTALACLAGGLDFLADDHCAVRVGSSGVVGYSLFSAAHMFPKDINYFPALRSVALTPTGYEKALAALYPEFERQLISSVPVRALLLPRQVAGAETHVRPATSMQVMLALMPSTRLLSRDLYAQAFEQYTAMVEHLPCYWLEVGHDLGRIPPAITERLRTLGD